MKHILPVGLTCLVLQSAHAGLLVTDISGNAEIDGRGRVTILAEIPDNARLTLAKDARVVAVDLASGREYLLTGSGSYRVMADGPRDAKGKPVDAKPLPAKNLPDVRLATGKAAQATLVMRSGNTRKFNVPLLHAPARTTVITDTPVFRWSGVEGAEHYRFTLTTPDGRIWKHTLAAMELALPAEQRLRPGERYTWRIEALASGTQGDRPVAEAATHFDVAPAEVMRRLAELRPAANAPFSRRVLYAAQLREAGADADANELWKALARERPNDDVLKGLAE